MVKNEPLDYLYGHLVNMKDKSMYLYIDNLVAKLPKENNRSLIENDGQLIINALFW